MPGVAIRVQTHAAEVVAEPLFQLPPRTGVERQPGAADDVLRLRRTGLDGPLPALAAACSDWACRLREVTGSPPRGR